MHKVIADISSLRPGTYLLSPEAGELKRNKMAVINRPDYPMLQTASLKRIILSLKQFFIVIRSAESGFRCVYWSNPGEYKSGPGIDKSCSIPLFIQANFIIILTVNP